MIWQSVNTLLSWPPCIPPHAIAIPNPPKLFPTQMRCAFLASYPIPSKEFEISSFLGPPPSLLSSSNTLLCSCSPHTQMYTDSQLGPSSLSTHIHTLGRISALTGKPSSRGFTWIHRFLVTKGSRVMPKLSKNNLNIGLKPLRSAPWAKFVFVFGP